MPSVQTANKITAFKGVASPSFQTTNKVSILLDHFPCLIKSGIIKSGINTNFRASVFLFCTLAVKFSDIYKNICLTCLSDTYCYWNVRL
uniref:Uncharacterized protein n=1 Tax=Oryza punctata TaxID=4537 RepID=A0A0E0K0X0_ORYPU